MKKLLLAAVMSAFVLLSACKEEDVLSEVERKISGSSSASEETTAKTDEKDSQKDTRKESSESDDSKEVQQEQESEAENSEDSVSSDNQAEDSKESEESVQSGDSEVLALGQEQYEKSCNTKWNFIINCPYELDYNSVTDSGAVLISDSEVGSIDDIVNDYCEVFSEPDDRLYEKYFEADGAVYCYDGGRGANIFYVYTDLSVVSQSEERVVFEAVSHYIDEEAYDETYEFSIVNTGDGWKTESFTLPY